MAPRVFRAPCRAGLLVAPLAALPSISHVIPQQVVQTLKSPRWNCNVFGRSQKMTVGNYVRLFLGWLSPSLSGAAARPRQPTGTAARPYLHPVYVTPLIPRSTTNFACNSLTTISNIEFTALELQRFWTLLKVHAIELHAELMEPGPATAASFESGTLRRCSRF